MPREPRSRRPGLAVAVASLAVVAAAVLTGCTAVPGIGSHQREQVFAHWADAPHGDDELLAPPAIVPEDATDLRVRMITSGPGDIVRWTSPSPLADEACEPGQLVGAPMLESTWWPAQIPREGFVCDAGWQVFQQDGFTYAWASV